MTRKLLQGNRRSSSHSCCPGQWRFSANTSIRASLISQMSLTTLACGQARCDVIRGSNGQVKKTQPSLKHRCTCTCMYHAHFIDRSLSECTRYVPRRCGVHNKSEQHRKTLLTTRSIQTLRIATDRASTTRKLAGPYLVAHATAGTDRVYAATCTIKCYRYN